MKVYLTSLSNYKGFSLIESLVGLGLLGGLSFWGMKTFDIQSEFTKTVEVQNEYESIFNDINQILSHEEACTYIFKNGNGPAWKADPSTPVAFSSATIYFKSKSSDTPMPRYYINSSKDAAPKYGNGTVQIIGLRLASDSLASIPLNELDGKTNAYVKFYFAQSKLGSQEMERKIPLFVSISDLVSRTIETCSSAGLTSVLDNTLLKLDGGTMRGDITMASPATIIFQSDKNGKSNIRKMTSVSNKILALRPVSFSWKSTDTSDYGFIAQEVREIFPDLIRTTDDGKLTMDYVQLSPLILKALQENDIKTETLKEEIKNLKNEQEMMKRFTEGSLEN